MTARKITARKKKPKNPNYPIVDKVERESLADTHPDECDCRWTLVEEEDYNGKEKKWLCFFGRDCSFEAEIKAFNKAKGIFNEMSQSDKK